MSTYIVYPPHDTDTDTVFFVYAFGQPKPSAVSNYLNYAGCVNDATIGAPAISSADFYQMCAYFRVTGYVSSGPIAFRVKVGGGIVYLSTGQTVTANGIYTENDFGISGAKVTKGDYITVEAVHPSGTFNVSDCQFNLAATQVIK